MILGLAHMLWCPHEDIASKSISALSAFFDIHKLLEQCQHVMADTENSQNYQFDRKKQLLIAPQDEIVRGVNGCGPEDSQLCNTNPQTNPQLPRGGTKESRRLRRSQVGVSFI